MRPLSSYRRRIATITSMPGDSALKPASTVTENEASNVVGEYGMLWSGVAVEKKVHYSFALETSGSLSVASPLSLLVRKLG